MKYCLLAALMLFSGKALAGTMLDMGAFYSSDSLTTPSSSTTGNTFYNVGLLLSYNKKIWAGWNYSGVSLSRAETATTTFTAQDMGPYFKWQFGSNQLYSMSFAYGLSSRATYSDGTVDEEWRGTSLWAQFGVSPEVANGVRVGGSLNYYSGSYSKKVVSSTESSISNTKTWIFPMINITMQW